MIAQTPFVVVDLETTGLEPRLDHIIEIAAVKVHGGKIVDEWTTLVNPGVFIPQITTNITGLTTQMLEKAPRFEDVASEYVDFLGENAVFVAHNVDFDRPFLNFHLKRAGHTEMPHPYLCTFKLAKRVHPNLPRYGLGALTDFFEVDLPQAHRAIHDARATAELFTKFMKVLENGGMRRLKDIPVIQNLPKENKELSEGQVSLF